MSCSFLKFMVTYLKSREDFIKQAARITRRESEKESKRQARRERRSPNQVSQRPMIRAISSKMIPLWYMINCLIFHIWFRGKRIVRIETSPSLVTLTTTSCLEEVVEWAAQTFTEIFTVEGLDIKVAKNEYYAWVFETWIGRIGS